MDFCSEALGPNIISEKPCVDGHEPQVLTLKNNVPFRCEAFIRAPLDIRVEFIVPIDIARIVLGPEVNDRYASGFSITTHYTTILNAVNESRRNSLPGSSLNPLKEFLCRAPSLSQLPPKTTSEGSQFAGQFFTGQQQLVVLRNRQYKHFLSVPLPNENKGLHVYESSLKHQDKFSLRNVHAITIRILRIVPTGPPALRLLEIWGQPAVGVELNTKMQLIANWNDFQAKRKSILSNNLVFYNSIVEENDKQIHSNEIEVKDDADIPDDFLDPLTCELMTIPLLLPSGNSIDSHSLDRFIAHEALWGRMPSDPFTGVPFKPHFTPVANTHLKARIDRFTLLNRVEGCGRTLCSVNAETSHSGRSRLITKRKSMQDESPNKHSKVVSQRSSPIINNCQFQGSMRPVGLLRSNSTRTENKMQTELSSRHSLIKRLNSSFRQTSRPRSAPLRPLSSTAELTIPEVVQGQCNEVRPLGGNETLLSPRSPGLSLFKSGMKKCSCLSDGLYQLTCPHPMCSSCLLKHRLPDGHIECPECFVRTQRSEVYRKHPGSIFVF